MIEREPQEEPFTEEEKNELLKEIKNTITTVKEQIENKEINSEKGSAALGILEQIEAQLGVPAMDIKRKNVDDLFKELQPFIGEKIISAGNEIIDMINEKK